MVIIVGNFDPLSFAALLQFSEVFVRAQLSVYNVKASWSCTAVTVTKQSKCKANPRPQVSERRSGSEQWPDRCSAVICSFSSRCVGAFFLFHEPFLALVATFHASLSWEFMVNSHSNKPRSLTLHHRASPPVLFLSLSAAPSEQICSFSLFLVALQPRFHLLRVVSSLRCFPSAVFCVFRRFRGNLDAVLPIQSWREQLWGFWKIYFFQLSM